MKYNWQQPDWPNFTYSLKGIEEVIYAFVEKLGRVGGLLEGLPENSKTETMIDLMISEAIKTSEIEGEYLSRKDVASSIRKNLGLLKRTGSIKDKRAEGAAELMIDVRKRYQEPLSKSMLMYWHKMLMKGSSHINAGVWRSHTEPMRVVSGAIGKEKIHFEAPPSDIVPREMDRFINWFNKTSPGGKKEINKVPVRSAIAHLYFESIHPFEDGNGRIGRAISEKALSQGVGRPVLLSLSNTIEASKNAYYNALQKAQRSNEITQWVEYFVQTVYEAQIQAEEQIEFTLKKTKFLDHFRGKLNDRQLKVIRRMLDEGPHRFEGGMSAKKYMSLAKTSKATATRDLQDLATKEALKPYGSGRSVRYQINFEFLW